MNNIAYMWIFPFVWLAVREGFCDADVITPQRRAPTPGGTLGLHWSVNRVGAIMLRHATKTLGARLTLARAAAGKFFHTSPVVESASSLPRKNGTLPLSPLLHLAPRLTRGRTY